MLAIDLAPDPTSLLFGPASWAAAVGLCAIAVTSLVNLVIAVMAERKRAADAAESKATALAAEERRAAEAAEVKATAIVADVERVEASRRAAEDARKAQDAAVEAASHARDVKETLQRTTSATDGKLDHVVSIVRETKAGVDVVRVSTNSVLGKALHVAAVALRRVADDHNDGRDIAAAVAAESDYRDHMAGQAVVDSTGKIATVPKA